MVLADVKLREHLAHLLVPKITATNHYQPARCVISQPGVSIRQPGVSIRQLGYTSEDHVILSDDQIQRQKQTHPMHIVNSIRTYQNHRRQPYCNTNKAQ